ncbi:MAG: nucleotidyltransferase [bacterium]
MTEIIDPRDLLVQVAKILDELKITHIVSGGMAVFVWGKPRFTADIDIVVELKEIDLPRLQKALQLLHEAGYIDLDMMKDALKHRGEFNFIDGATGVKVDFYIAQKDDFGVSALKRGRREEINGYKVNFISPEDLILVKLKWHKEGDSAKQLEDVKSILKTSGDKLDKKYLMAWAIKLDVSDILDNLT